MTSVTRTVISFVALALPLTVALAEGDSPHWTKDGCVSCHSETAPSARPANLGAGGVEGQCETCHGDRGSAVPCRHQSGVLAKSLSIPDSLAGSLQEGKVVCSTCHDVIYQCERPRIHYSFQNPGFLRDRTSRNTADYCFKCHESSGYAKLNPHTGPIDNPADPTCRLCHDGMPQSADNGELLVQYNMAGNLNDQCQGCHNSRPHPRSMSFTKPVEDEGWVHFVQPSVAVLENMQKSQAATGIKLPLDPQNGEVFCATCHNPHHFEIGGKSGSPKHETKHRLRMDNICQACHDK